MPATAIRRIISGTQRDNGTKLFQAITPTETTATPNRKSSAKKDGSRSSAVMMPPALSKAHGSTKRNTAERRLKLPLASVIQATRKAEIVRQAIRQRLSKACGGCCFVSNFLVLVDFRSSSAFDGALRQRATDRGTERIIS